VLHSTVHSGPAAIHHADECPLSPCCTAVSITLEPGGYRVTAVGPTGVQFMLAANVAAAALVAVTALAEVAR
jgi:hypothetical protein